MEKAFRYNNAPITEALIDIRVTLDASVPPMEAFKRFGSEVKNSYPQVANREMFHAEINLAQGASSRKEMVGYIFHTNDRLQAVQTRLDGFTFSRFSPYEDWAHLHAEAKRLWVLFCQVCRPKEITRLAVRYINVLRLPVKDDVLEFGEFLKTFPVVGDGPSGDLAQFMLRMVLPQPDLESVLVLTEALIPPDKPNSASVILDLDLFKENLALSPDEEQVWTLLNQFRDRKNQYFEASITDATRRLFE